VVAVRDSVALVTGGNRGLGATIVQELLDRGAARVYATARNPQPSADPRIIPVALDVNNPTSVAALAARAGDVTILVNNAGVSDNAPLLTGDFDAIQAVFETNLYGPLRVARAFAPILAANGGGAILNIHSVLSWFVSGQATGAYSASKAALWSATNSLRLELQGQGTLVTGLHVGYIDTEMARAVAGPKNDPREVARQAVAGIEAGAYEILVDEVTRRVKSGLAGDLTALYPQLAAR
jgi:NAD(P)-dependent dehydrogenase (short-subunit alcohol dehydrogenase family)